MDAGEWPDLRAVDLFWLSSYTSQPLRPFLVQECAARGVRLQPRFGPFGQLEQVVLDATSPLYQPSSDVVMISTRVDDLDPDLLVRFLSLSSDEVAARSERIVERVLALARAIRTRSEVPVFVWNWVAPPVLISGLADQTLSPSLTGMLHQMNERLAAGIRGFAHVYVFDFATLACESGLWHLLDSRLEFRARLPFGTEGMVAVAQRTARYIAAMVVPPRKCLVVDLDNTLWGGVLGEDGVGGIAIGEDHPGRAYRALQSYLLGLRDRGILLAIASKNNREEALDVLRTHPDCQLKPEHFSAIEIGWWDKATSLRRIAKSLSIGTDAVALLDDSHFERDWVRTQLPEVAIIDLPVDPDGFIAAIDASALFDQLIVLNEDRNRAGMYRQDAVRQESLATARSVAEFLDQLGLTATVGRVGDQTIERVAQLLAKTNQFNVTTRRHSESELRKMLTDGAVAVWMRVADKFGDLGLVGVAIAIQESHTTWRVDSFLLSCRAIGRRAESVLMAYLVRSARARGARRMIGEFIPTAKNAPAVSVFKDAGFSPADTDGRRWVLDIGDREPEASTSFTVTEESNVHS